MQMPIRHAVGAKMDHSLRSKMISLRVSAEEFEALQKLYPTYGARSVSDFARLAMKRVISGSFAGDDALLTRVNDLAQRVSSMEARFGFVRNSKSDSLVGKAREDT